MKVLVKLFQKLAQWRARNGLARFELPRPSQGAKFPLTALLLCGELASLFSSCAYIVKRKATKEFFAINRSSCLYLHDWVLI